MDPEFFLTDLIEVVMAYPSWVALKAPDPVRGLKAKFKFCPSIAEVKETFDGWVGDQQRLEELHERFDGLVAVPALPAPPREPGTDYVTMTARYGRPIGPFEQGTTGEQYAGTGKGTGGAGPSEVFAKIAADARAKMEARRAAAKPAQEAAE